MFLGRGVRALEKLVLQILTGFADKLVYFESNTQGYVNYVKVLLFYISLCKTSMATNDPRSQTQSTVPPKISEVKLKKSPQ
jgi:hypothetical protein